MAKTFDNVDEAKSMNYLFLTTQMTYALAEQSPAPPPLYLLSLPYELYSLVRHLVVHKLLGKVPNVDQTGRDELFEEMSVRAMRVGGCAATWDVSAAWSAAVTHSLAQTRGKRA